MKLVTKFLTTEASIYFNEYTQMYIVTARQRQIFTSKSKEMCVGLSLDRDEIAQRLSSIKKCSAWIVGIEMSTSLENV